MTGNISYENMDSYENPEFLPLENLKLKVKTNGVVETIDALSKKWKNNHYFLHYEAPNIYNDDGIEIQGAKERWVEIVNYMINDLKWSLSLPFYRHLKMLKESLIIVLFILMQQYQQIL